jgi:deazaflavin-dependent oxidoreductase (nitroreductase family)
VLRVTSQRSSEFTTPDRSKIPAISASHVAMMETSDDDSVWVWVNMHHLLLRTIGRRTGKEHRVALPFWGDAQGHRIVVASFSGAPKDPAWFLNLADRSANPQVLVRVQGGAYWAVPEILDGEEYHEVWRSLILDRPHYADYQANTDRRIPLVRLPESRAA